MLPLLHVYEAAPDAFRTGEVGPLKLPRPDPDRTATLEGLMDCEPTAVQPKVWGTAAGDDGMAES